MKGPPRWPRGPRTTPTAVSVGLADIQLSVVRMSFAGYATISAKSNACLATASCDDVESGLTFYRTSLHSQLRGHFTTIRHIMCEAPEEDG